MASVRGFVRSIAERTSSSRRRKGFSLLELILALGLTVIVVSAITTAIRLYMFQLQQRQKEIETKQVSRSVIRMFTSDVRAAIQFKSVDNSGLENLIASQSLSGIGGGPLVDVDSEQEDVDPDDLEQTILDAVAAGGGPDAGAEQSDGAGSAPADGGGTADSNDESEEAEEEAELGRPTLIGNNYFLRFDTSYLPRLHEYNPLIARGIEAQQLPSDIKTITYFFSDVPPATQEELADESFGKRGGLYRRQIDRAIEAHQSGDENVDIVVRPDEYSELISPEISSIQFRYWDGEDWLAEWNSEENGGFPAAIEIQVVIDPERASDELAEGDPQRLEVETIRSVIHLPIAEINQEEDEEEESR